MSRSTAARSIPAPRRFALESLERRELMAGNVTVQLTAGNLFITGDNDANGIFIRELGDQQFAIIGTKVGSGNTTIDGAGFKIVNGVTGNVVMNMNGGNDAVTIDNGASVLATRAGLPSTGQFPGFLKNMQVFLGNGSDTFTTNGMQVQGRMTLDTGFSNEADTVKLDGLVVRAENTGGLGLEIDTNGGNDRVDIIDGTFSGLVDIDTGSEDDVVNVSEILINLEADIRIRTQNGNDNVLVDDALLDGSLDIETGFGGDFVSLRDIVMETLEVDLGGDNDLMQIEEVIAELADFNGNLGTDAFIDQGDNDILALTIRNFEIVVD